MSNSLMRLVIALNLTICSLAQAADHQLPGRIIRVVDGDSLILGISHSQYRIELAGIDAPELNQPWGNTAADRLHNSLTGAFVVVTQAHTGANGTTTGTLIFKGRDIALDLIHDGLAWSTIPPGAAQTGDSHPYPVAEAQARLERRGLWSDESPIPPWEWRRRQPGITD
ncbi:MAG: thermonuclease family protein [Sedimenticolaceae bacterium]